jgi:hypothetical protein
MSMRKLLLLVIALACVVVVVTTPQVREALGDLAGAVQRDVGPEPTETLGEHPKVFTAAGDPYYHRRDCPRLEGLRPTVMPLPKAQELAEPCPECHPPE